MGSSNSGPRCSSPLHDTKIACFGLLCAVPLLYAVLLLARRRALRAGFVTKLGAAIEFLFDDYNISTSTWALLWEPLEMCRKLALSTSLAGSQTAISLHSHPHPIDRRSHPCGGIYSGVGLADRRDV